MNAYTIIVLILIVCASLLELGEKFFNFSS